MKCSGCDEDYTNLIDTAFGIICQGCKEIIDRDNQEEDEMKVGKYFTGKHLAKEDLEGKEHKATIKSAKIEMVGNEEQGQEQKVVIYFQEFDKGLALNATNYQVIVDVCNGSDDTDDWIGHSFILYVDPDVMFGKKKVGGLRIRVQNSQLRNGALSSEEIVRIMDNAENLGWKGSELRKKIKDKFGVDNIANFPKSRLSELAEMIEMGV